MKKFLVVYLLIFISCKNGKKQEKITIDKPVKELKKEINLKYLQGVWAYGKEEPKAEFIIEKDSVYYVEHSTELANYIKYKVKNDSIFFFKEEISKGKILMNTKDSLQINWNNHDWISKYVRFDE